MRPSPLRVLFAVPVLAASPAAAQSFDPASQAKGWAHQDRDFSFTFFDASTRSLITWDKGFGVMNTLSLAKLKDEPSMWLMDRYNNAWVVCGDTLYFMTKDGKVDRKEKLPAEVADLAWDAQTGFVLCYKTAEPYLEMRDMKDGSVDWSHGVKPKPPKKGEAPEAARSLYRVCMKSLPGGDSQVLFTDGPGLDMTVLAGKNGAPLVRTILRLKGQPGPVLDYAKAEPGALCLFFGKDVAYAAVDSAALPPAAAPGLNGLLLARLDLASGAITFLPTGFMPDHRFIGLVDGQAVFIKPSGGLAFVPAP